MTNITEYFTSLAEPIFSICTATESGLDDFLLRLNEGPTPKVVVRVCRGSKMKDTDGVFDEFAAAFQFPYYFGENWAAFNDCLTDLSWLPAGAYLVCITKADQLLSSETPASFEVLVRNLRNIARGWGGENPNLALMGRKATPFHILMQVSKDVEQITLNRLASAGATAEVVGWK